MPTYALRPGDFLNTGGRRPRSAPALDSPSLADDFGQPCSRPDRSGSAGWLPGVELSHQFAIGRSGRGQLIAAFFELAAQLEELLLAVGECLLKAVDVVGRPQAALTEDGVPVTVLS